MDYIDAEGYRQEVDFDVDKFFEFIIREKKYKKAGRPKHINEILNKCIRAAASKTNIYGDKLSSVIKIVLIDF